MPICSFTSGVKAFLTSHWTIPCNSLAESVSPSQFGPTASPTTTPLHLCVQAFGKTLSTSGVLNTDLFTQQSLHCPLTAFTKANLNPSFLSGSAVLRFSLQDLRRGDCFYLLPLICLCFHVAEITLYSNCLFTGWLSLLAYICMKKGTVQFVMPVCYLARVWQSRYLLNACSINVS